MEAPMNPTETLRAAATKLREMAQAATPGPWLRDHHGSWAGSNVVLNSEGHPVEICGVDAPEVGYLEASSTRALIATLGPTFAVLVADWLDDAATGEDWLDAQLAPFAPRLPDWTPLALARHVLGEEVPQIAPAQPQERPKPANVGTGEGTGLEGAQIGAQEIDPKRPREGE